MPQNLKNDSAHVPVLLHEVIDALAPKEGEIVLDATLGGGGHARALAERIGKKGTLIGLDADGGALMRAKKNLAGVSAKILVAKSNFRFVKEALGTLGVKHIDKALLDLGLSSDQLESHHMEKGRGFSFLRDEPLLMTFEDEPQAETVTARDIVNYASAESIADMLFAYADERHSRKIAAAIAEARAQKPIQTATELAHIVESVVSRRTKTHPATKTFQALRIAVNDEITALREGLISVEELLSPGGVLAVITFHSLEDGVVKRIFRAWVQEKKGVLLNKKAIMPSREEVQKNPRARSAQLRVYIKNTR